MNTTTKLSSETDVNTCLQRLLASPIFARAERQKRLLSYLVAQALSGKAEQIKGYTLGVEVFDRAVDFDPAIDAIVRVQVGQLRAKLREYYDTYGRADPLRFELPKGGYALGLLPNAERPPQAERESPTRPATALPDLIEDKPSLAVLPFVNWSSDPEQEYFADGITEDLTTELSRLPGLFVISRHSAFVYKGVAKGAAEISAELGVRYLLEGSVRRWDQKVRISAQLIDAQSGAHLWAERYDRKLKDIFAVQDDVTQRIVEVLQVKFTPGESRDLGYEGTHSMEAYDLLLRGRERYFVMTLDASRQAKVFCLKALEIDPGYAKAHVQLAGIYIRDWALDWEHDPQVVEIAFEHANKALELDPELPLAYATLSFVQLWRKKRESAIKAGYRAVETDPNSANAHLYLSFALTASNRGEEALTHITKAIRLNPVPSPIYLTALGVCYWVLGDNDKAIEAHERGYQLNPKYTINLRCLILRYAQAGRDDDARRARAELFHLEPGCRAVFFAPYFLDEELASRHRRDVKRAEDL